MERITSKQVSGLMEAYANVYPSQDLTEEQIWEQVEEWVNSLVEEGYDLSEYTWEDMYENYLSEMGQRMTTGQATVQRPAPTAAPKPTPTAYRPAGGAMGGGRGSVSSPGGVRPSAAPYQSRFAGARDAAFARARQIQGSPVVGPRVFAPAPSARPSAQTTAARPIAAQKPTPTSQPSIAQSYSMRPGAVAVAPRTGTTTTIPQSTGSPVQGYQTAMQKRPSLAQQAAELRAMRAASQQRQGVTPSSNLTQSFDPFDVVLEYLVSEGYADTNEDALVIMANMSEEWRQNIIDQVIS